jgi:hypothetical protein
MRQVLPFHLSTIVCGPGECREEPTAMHDLLDVHETA